MLHQALMVLKMDPANAAEVAKIFAEHDETDLPRQIGVSGRTLFRFHDLYMHLIWAERDFMPDLHRARNHPEFVRTNDRLAPLLTAYSSDWKALGDSKAEVFYHRTWE